ELDLDLERAVQATCLDAIDAELLHSAHDCSDGGLAVAIAECCFSTLSRDTIGAEIDLQSSLSTDSLLFGESPSRIIVSLPESALPQLSDLAKRNDILPQVIGRVGG